MVKADLYLSRGFPTFNIFKALLILSLIGYPFTYRDFPFFDKICSKSSAAELSYEYSPGEKYAKSLYPFPTYNKSAADDFEHILSKK